MDEFTHIDQSGKAKMVDVSEKNDTRREALACGRVTMRPETLALIKKGEIKKGAVLETARVAGIMGVKKTPELIPMCHQLLISGIDINFEFIDKRTIEVKATARTTGKTGVEMETITGVSAALLNAYDMLKPLDTELSMTNIQVVEKRGGKSQYRETFESPLKAAVLVISDSTYEGAREDKSGKIINEFLEEMPVETVVYEILPDNQQQIQDRILSLVKEDSCDLVITTGGTGFGPKDVTVEATRPILEKMAPGIVEKIRDYGSQRTPYAMLSREVAGTIGESLVLNLPGSSNGAKESMQALFPGVLHIFPMLWGGGHEK
jgi:molybdenum cofactor biosynthesis protein MoaC